jgi:hypothetical protein
MTAQKHARSPAPLPGIAPAAIRSFLVQAAELPSWTADYLRKILAVDAAAANQVLLALEASGYIEPMPGKRGSWRNTEAGNRMAGVSRAKPILRKTLDESLEALRDRICRVNHDPRFLYRVEKAVLFGPYLTDKQDRLKGLDVAIQFAPKEQDPARLEQLVQERAAEAERAGTHFKSYADRMRYGENGSCSVARRRSVRRAPQCVGSACNVRVPETVYISRRGVIRGHGQLPCSRQSDR